LRLLLRTGQSVAVNGIEMSIQSFSVLAPTPGSLGAARGFDDDGHVTAVATFTDGTEAVLNISVP